MAGSFAALTLSASLVAAEETVPDHIHDWVCPCRRMNSGNPRVAFTAENIQCWTLPTKENPLERDGFICWTMEAGSRKNPVTDIRVHRGENYVGSVSLSKPSTDWRLYSLKSGGPTYYTETFRSPFEALVHLIRDLK